MNKRKTYPQSPRPEFALTGLALGACAGLVIGLIVEIALRRSMMVMQAGGIVGISVGALAESIRFGWRKSRYRKLHKETSAPETIRR